MGLDRGKQVPGSALEQQLCGLGGGGFSGCLGQRVPSSPARREGPVSGQQEDPWPLRGQGLVLGVSMLHTSF